MKKEIKGLIAALCAGVFIYLLGAFYAADFNIANWTVLSRGAAVIFAGPLIVLAYTIGLND